MQRLLGRDDVKTVLDIGGCFGELALQFEGMFPKANIWSFEPNPETYQKLTANIAGHDRITGVPKGCFSEKKETELFVNSWPGACSLLDRPEVDRPYHSPNAVHVGKVQVEVVPLDEWVREEPKIDKVDLLKLDVQGAELKVLEGAGDVLRNASAVYSEVQFFPNYDKACLLEELWGHLREQGFSLFQLYSIWGASDGQIVQGDALFISEEVRSKVLSKKKPFASVTYLPI
jgi:FkbM family methyltransferase